MYTFLVLGIIPGTTFQITFQLWLDAVAGLMTLGLLIRLMTEHRSTRGISKPLRIPLHARQLHLRA
jgi:hypothetical protein